MRNGKRREKQKVLWLMRFLENWCSKEELSRLAERHIQALKAGNVFEKHAYFMTEALVTADIPSEIQNEMVKTAKDFLTQKHSAYADELSTSYNQHMKEALDYYKKRQYREALNTFLEIENKNRTVQRWLGFLYHRKFKDFKNAEKYYLMAAAKEDIKAMGGLAILYLLERKNKPEAVTLANKAFSIRADAYTSGIYTLMLLWEKNIEDAFHSLNLFIQLEGPAKLSEFFEPLLMFLLARKEYTAVLKLFNENKFDIRERYKPIYYALMTLMQDVYPDEHRKMGPEIKQTVREVLNQIDQISLDYS
jgi:TPR repeat protein